MSDSLTELQKKKKTRFPLSRIKKLIQQNEDIGKTSITVPVVLSKAIELFLEQTIADLVRRADEHRTTKIQMEHFKEVAEASKELCRFLKLDGNDAEDK